MRKHVRFAIALAALLSSLPAPADALRITELMALNDSTVTDEDDDFSDWLEIHNETAAPVALGGWFLTDTAGDLTKWELPATTLPAGGYLLVWASSKNRTTVPGPLHTSFALSGGGEYLAIVQPDGVTVEHEYAPQYPAQLDDVSYGVAADLVTERCFLEPTPGGPNDESTPCGVVDEVSFSVERGFFDSPFAVALSTATLGATIRYTTDGSAPTQSHGSVYAAPVAISTTTPLRAAAFKTGLISARVLTHTYIFLADVLGQSFATLPPGYPDKWAGGVSADYDMDPDVVNDPTYAAEIVADMKSIPTMSVVMNRDDLFHSSQGIYTHPNAHGGEWERAASMELIFDGDAEDDTQVDGGLRIQGEYSRSPDVKKHSFRLSFKNEFGPPVWEYPFFLDSDADRMDQLVLTGGHGDAWHGGHEATSYIRDTFCKDTQLDMGQLASHSRYVHLYLNGIYWGVYRITERPNAGFLAEHLGGEKEDYDVIKARDVEDGDKQAWDTMQTLAKAGLESQSAYQALKQYVDVDNLIDYFLINFYGNNTDWDSKNWYAGRERAPGAGFKFFCWDAEQTIATPFGSRITMNNYDCPSSVFSNLRQENAEFRVRMGDRAHRHLFNGGALTPKRVIARWNERADEIYGALVGESARWGDKGREQPFTRDVEWVVERQRLMLSYFSKRTAIFVGQLRDYGLYPTVVAPAFDRHGGDFVAGDDLTITAPAGDVYYTVDGSDPRLTGGALSPSAQLYTAPIPLAQRVTIAARARVGGEWSALNEAEFMRDVPVRVTEIMYHPAGTGALEFVELTNVGASSVALAGLSFTDGIDFAFASGSLAAGARVLLVEDQAAFDAHYGPGAPVAGVYSGRLENAGERIVLEGPDGSVVQDFRFDDAWHPASDGGGRSLVVIDADGPKDAWTRRDGWRASALADGSAGDADAPLCSNGVDDDGDGQADFPADDGCASAAQDLEDPQCDDGVDNDADGGSDVVDEECASTSDSLEGPEPVNPFHCYKTRANRSGPVFEPEEVLLDDELGGAGSYAVRKRTSLCLAADLDGAGIEDPGVHLEAYDIAPASGAPLPIALSGVRVETSFGPLYVDTGKPDRYLVPAAADLDSPVSQPNESAHPVDRYKCYRVALTDFTPKYFPAQAQVELADLLEHRDYKLKKPARLCAPVAADGSDVEAPQRHLFCYPTRAAKHSPRHTPVAAIHAATELGASLHDTQREEEVCLPATVIVP